ncbi:MAG: hypothetical protein ISS00_03385 [Candidatus Marinimicrobia bacterium]|nr:hypothetical protein [Candidatus Neomarinimicrobiota bacterium]
MNLKQHKLSKDRRFFFLVSGAIIWLGIFLTGFETASFIFYIPGISFFFAVTTGYCPGMIISKILFGGK